MKTYRLKTEEELKATGWYLHEGCWKHHNLSETLVDSMFIEVKDLTTEDKQRIQEESTEAHPVYAKNWYWHKEMFVEETTPEIPEDLLKQIGDIFQGTPSYDKRRLEANKAIVTLLAQAVMDYPTMRFGQLLESLGIVRVEMVDTPEKTYLGTWWAREPHLEPWDLLKRIQKKFYERGKKD